MLPIICPICGSINSLVEVADGIYVCKICNFRGKLSGESMFRS